MIYVTTSGRNIQYTSNTRTVEERMEESALESRVQKKKKSYFLRLAFLFRPSKYSLSNLTGFFFRHPANNCTLHQSNRLRLADDHFSFTFIEIFKKKKKKQPIKNRANLSSVITFSCYAMYLAPFLSVYVSHWTAVWNVKTICPWPYLRKNVPICWTKQTLV